MLIKPAGIEAISQAWGEGGGGGIPAGQIFTPYIC